MGAILRLAIRTQSQDWHWAVRQQWGNIHRPRLEEQGIIHRQAERVLRCSLGRKLRGSKKGQRHNGTYDRRMHIQVLTEEGIAMGRASGLSLCA